MTQAEILAYNRGVAALAAVAAASADVLTARLVERPTRFNHAIGALEGVVEASSELILPLPPDNAAAAAAAPPRPTSPSSTQLPDDVAGTIDVKPVETTPCF